MEAALTSNVPRTAVDRGRDAAERGLKSAHRFIKDPSNRKTIECALRIRAVESALYDLFGRGKLHGTIHTCIGQEFSGAILARHLGPGDFITSNHRCHGHFIAATGNWRGLIDEIIGNQDGVCAGIGSSQHLWAPNFISNGQQGGLLPVAAGVALDRRLKGAGDVVTSFLGEGTLGEGITYETLNIDALWGLPHVVICENNFYSQSTGQDRSVSGSIAKRAAGFGVAVEETDTWDLLGLDAALGRAFKRAREESRPTFVVLTTYRLNPHSRGDDLRDKSEVSWFRTRDPATIAIQNYSHFASQFDEMTEDAKRYVELALAKPALPADKYFGDQLPRSPRMDDVTRGPEAVDDDKRVAQQLNDFYKSWLARDEDALFIGEDIEDPYGGAFKVSKGFTSAFPDRALTTPISEAAITGVGVGLAITGRRAFVEIMFGDFITYAFDQIVNNASKMHHMYNRHLSCPVVIRAPMGGRRGYGPTHSQSLERFLIGIDNCCTVSLNSLVPVGRQLGAVDAFRCPFIILENKADYANRTFAPPDGLVVETDDGALPTIRVAPQDGRTTVTLLTYGGMARLVADHLIEIFERTDCVPELIVLTSLSPLNLGPIAESVGRTGRLVIIEEGPGFGNVGAEVAAQLGEQIGLDFVVARVNGKATPIPSAPALEAATLPGVDDICAALAIVTEPRL